MTPIWNNARTEVITIGAQHQPSNSNVCGGGHLDGHALGASGRGVAEGAAQAIAELQGDDRLGEVIVVVPPGATAGTLRRLLPRGLGRSSPASAS